MAVDAPYAMLDPLAPPDIVPQCTCCGAQQCAYCGAQSVDTYAIWPLGPCIQGWIQAVGYLNLFRPYFAITNCPPSGRCYWDHKAVWADVYGNSFIYEAWLDVNPVDGSAQLSISFTSITNYAGSCSFGWKYVTPPGVPWNCTGPNIMILAGHTPYPTGGNCYFNCADPTVLVQPAPQSDCYPTPPPNPNDFG